MGSMRSVPACASGSRLTLFRVLASGLPGGLGVWLSAGSGVQAPLPSAAAACSACVAGVPGQALVTSVSESQPRM